MDRKMELINKIVENSINIYTVELDKVEDDKCIKVIHDNNKIINAAIKKHKYSFLKEYNDTTIVRDEVYATYYESIIKLVEKENYSYEDLEIIADDINYEYHKITKQFIKKLMCYITNDIRKRLIPESRRDQSNHSFKLIDTRVDYYEDYNLIECFIDTVENEEGFGPANEFSKWILDNKDIFAHGQRAYMDPNSDVVYEEENSEDMMKKRIRRRYKNTSKAPQSKEEAKEQNRLKKINTIEELLNIEDTDEFVQAIGKKQSKAYISDAIIDYVSPQERINFNKGTITKQTIKEYRVALFKKLNELSL